MAVKQLTQNQIDFINQFLEFDGMNSVTAINLYQLFDKQHPELNQMTDNDISNLWEHIGQQMTGQAINHYDADVTKIKPMPHVQIFSGRKFSNNNLQSIYYKPLLSTDPNYPDDSTKNNQKIVIKYFHGNQTITLPDVNTVFINPEFKHAIIFNKSDTMLSQNQKTDAKLSHANNSDPIFQFTLHAINPKTNQLKPEYNQTFTGHYNDFKSQKLLNNFLTYCKTLQKQPEDLNYFGYLKSGFKSSSTNQTLNNILEYITGIPSNPNDYCDYTDSLYQIQDKNNHTLYTINVPELAFLCTDKSWSQYYETYDNLNAFEKFRINKLIQSFFSLNFQEKSSQSSKDSKDISDDEFLKILKNHLKPEYHLVKLENPKKTDDNDQVYRVPDLIKPAINSYNLSQADKDLIINWITGSHDQILNRNVLMAEDSGNAASYFVDDPKIVKEISAVTILSQYLTAIHHNDVPYEIAQGVAKMIYAQQDLFNPNFVDNQTDKSNSNEHKSTKYQLDQFNEATRKFLLNLKIDSSQISQNGYANQISLKSLIDYIDAVKHHKPITAEMLGLITSMQDSDSDNDPEQNSSNDQNNQKIIINEAANANLFNKLTIVNNWKNLPEIKKLAPSVKSRVVNVYQINTDHKLDTPNIKTLCHGTGNYSLISILKSGLLTSDELAAQNNKNWSYTGSGLGVGIYFARLDQAEKAANYTDYGPMNHYMFIANVGYHKVYNVNYYDESATKNANTDLVWAHKTGSYDRDELVAKSGKQVQLRYLLELKNN